MDRRSIHLQEHDGPTDSTTTEETELDDEIGRPRGSSSRPTHTAAAVMFAHRTRAANPAPPPYWTPEPPIRDALETESSTVQRETARACRALRVGGDAWPGLQRQKHVAFLRNSLGTLPAGFVAVDASRPWMLYWALTGLYLLGEDVSEYRERYENGIETPPPSLSPQATSVAHPPGACRMTARPVHQIER